MGDEREKAQRARRVELSTQLISKYYYDLRIEMSIKLSLNRHFFSQKKSKTLTT